MTGPSFRLAAVFVGILLSSYDIFVIEAFLSPTTFIRRQELPRVSVCRLKRPVSHFSSRSRTCLKVSTSRNRVTNSTSSDGEANGDIPSNDVQKKEKSSVSERFRRLKDLMSGNDLVGDTKKSTGGNEEQASSPDGPSSPRQPKPDSRLRFRLLKDLMWVRETLEDLTAAEFACSVEAADTRTRQRAVDYDNLLTKLNTRIVDMVGPNADGPFLLRGTNDGLKMSDDPVVIEGYGMGQSVYDQSQRRDLLKKVLKTRKSLKKVMKKHERDAETDEDGKFELKIPELRVEIPKDEDSSSAPGAKLYVRDDGTVDWDGALQDRAALRELGGAVWARINGENPSSLDEESDERNSGALATHEPAKVTANIEDTPEIRKARDELNRLKIAYEEQEVSHTALLNSAISTGQVVANVRLASLEPSLRNRIRESAESLELMEQNVLFQTLVYELERIFAYLSTEIGNPQLTGYVPLQDRLNVAEFGLLESQIEAFHRELEADGTIDADILAVVMDQLTDFKGRLGIDYYVTGLTYDREAIMTWLNQLVQKTKNGLGFYVKGCRLFWDDIIFCSGLILRAAQGYTLKPREVRTLRRTFKDIITFIPVVIILIIPLSPVGHVLVFGAIQRFFPGFFPSCFTEQRQNLLQLYESAEFTEFQINENFQDKVSRFFEAMLFFVADKSKSTYLELTGQAPKALPGQKIDESKDESNGKSLNS